MKNIDQFEIWTSDISYPQEDESSSLYLLVLQNSILNEFHPTVIVCPITTKVIAGSEILRVHVPGNSTQIESDCDVVIDQIRVIGTDRLIKKKGKLPMEYAEKVKENIKIVIDIDI